jgi:hypothetical protein
MIGLSMLKYPRVPLSGDFGREELHWPGISVYNTIKFETRYLAMIRGLKSEEYRETLPCHVQRFEIRRI